MMTGSRQGAVTTYSYTATTKLTGQVLAGGWATLVNDPIGNVLVKWYQGLAPQTMNYDAASRLVTQTMGQAVTGYTYTPAGAMSSENAGGAVTGYVYDGENRELKMTNPIFQGYTSTYAGNGLRRTFQKPVGAVSTMVWDGTNYLGEVQ